MINEFDQSIIFTCAGITDPNDFLFQHERSIFPCVKYTRKVVNTCCYFNGNVPTQCCSHFDQPAPGCKPGSRFNIKTPSHRHGQPLPAAFPLTWELPILVRWDHETSLYWNRAQNVFHRGDLPLWKIRRHSKVKDSTVNILTWTIFR